MNDSPDSTSNIAPPMSPLRVGSKPPEKKRPREKAPRKKPQEGENTGAREIQIGVKRLMCGYNLNVSTCCLWEGY